MSADMAMPGTACSQYEALLEDYLHSALDAAGAKRAEQHMSSCATCRETFEKAQMASRVFQYAAPQQSAPDPGFARLVMARIRAAESEMTAERTGFWQSLVALGWRFTATAAFALLILVAYDAGHARRAQPNQTAVRPTEASDFLFASDPARPPADRDEVLIMVAETDHGTH